MGIGFSLQSKKDNQQVDAPVISAWFTKTEYYHFLDRLAESADLEKQWKKLRRAESRVQEDLRAGRELEGAQPHPAPDLEARKDRRVKRLLTMTGEEPLLFFLLMSHTGGKLDGKPCAEAGRRLREVVEDWEPTPSGLTGWREMAIEISEAMSLAAKNKLRLVLTR